MERGVDVMTEKPMVIDEAQCRAVLDAEKKTGRKVVVTHNYRYAPKHQKIKELLMGGEIGKITSVDFNWFLDTSHGADYFRRWHRLRSKSGSLWVHKASHHFDLINWWIDGEPVEVSALGSAGELRQERALQAHELPYVSRTRTSARTTGTSTRTGTSSPSTTTANRRTAISATAASSRKTSTSSTP